MDPQNISVVGRPFLGALLAAAVGVFAASWLMRPRIIRWAIRGCALLIVVVFAAACVNSYYDYLPTLAAVMGRRAVDQMSEARFRQLEAASAADTPLSVRMRDWAPEPLGQSASKLVPFCSHW